MRRKAKTYAELACANHLRTSVHYARLCQTAANTARLALLKATGAFISLPAICIRISEIQRTADHATGLLQWVRSGAEALDHAGCYKLSKELQRLGKRSSREAVKLLELAQK